MDTNARIATLMLHGCSMWTRKRAVHYRSINVLSGETPALTYARRVPGNATHPGYDEFVWRCPAPS